MKRIFLLKTSSIKKNMINFSILLISLLVGSVIFIAMLQQSERGILTFIYSALAVASIYGFCLLFKQAIVAIKKALES